MRHFLPAIDIFVDAAAGSGVERDEGCSTNINNIISQTKSNYNNIGNN